MAAMEGGPAPQASESREPAFPAPVRESRALQPALILVCLIVAVLSSLGAPLIPSIAQATGVSLSTAGWLLTITLLTGALSTPMMGRLSDGPHQKRVVVVSLCAVLAGCVIAATTSSFSMLMAGRALQGLGLGLLPVTMSIARRHLPVVQATKAIALLSVTGAIGVGLGYPVTGVLAEVSDYHLAFWFGAGVVALALATALVALPGRSAVPSKPFDVIGASLMSVAVSILIIVLSEAADWGWLSLRVLGLLLVSFALIAAWGRYELQATDPMVELRHARHRMVLTADLAGFLMSVAMYLFLPIIVEFIQIPASNGYGFGVTVVVAGCSLIPLSIGTLAASRLAVAFERRFGRRPVIPVGAVLFALSMLLFAVEHNHLWEAFVSTAIAGIGIGFTFAAMPGFIVETVGAHETGSALGFYQILRSIGLAVGSALSAVVLAAYTSGADPLPAVGGFRTTLLIGSVLCLLTGVLCWLMPGPMRRPVQRSTRHPATPETLTAAWQPAEASVVEGA